MSPNNKAALRLAFVHPSLCERGGAENYLITAASGLAQRGHAVDILTADYDATYFPALEQAEYRVELLGGRGYHQGLAETLAMRRQLPARLQGYDLVIPVNFPAHLWTSALSRPARCVWLCFEPKRNLYPKIMYAEAGDFKAHGYRTAADYRGWRGWVRLLTRDPHVLLPYSVRSALQRSLDRLAVRRVDHILTHSPYTAEKIHRIYPGKAVDVVWAGVAVPPSDQRANEPLILVPTRLERIKNVEVVLRAIHTLRSQGLLTGWRVVVLGTGSDELRLRTLNSSLGLDSIVTFTGFVGDAERDALYSRCAMVVYPSLAEPLGMPCVEAGLHGKPVIAANAGGPASFIEHMKTGLLVDVSQPDAVAQAIAELMASPEYVRNLGAAARTAFIPRFGLDAWLASFEDTLLSQGTYKSR